MTRTLLLLFFGIGAGLSAAESADTEVSGRALFFSEPDFHGECLIVTAGGEIRDLAGTRAADGRRWDDRIASVRLEGSVTVTLYADPRYRGNSAQLRRSIRNLGSLALGAAQTGNWCCQASSLRVGADEVDGDAPSAAEIDRLIVSVYRDVLGRDPDFAGLQNYRHRLADDGWSEEQLRGALKASREFRQRDLDAIVRRAYRIELGREPDAEGRRTYLRALREKGWTEGELRLDLRRSEEGRQHRLREIVRRAYLEILDREPDPAGWTHYSDLLGRGWTERQLREHLRASEEYRIKHRSRPPEARPH